MVVSGRSDAPAPDPRWGLSDHSSSGRPLVYRPAGRHRRKWSPKKLVSGLFRPAPSDSVPSGRPREFQRPETHLLEDDHAQSPKDVICYLDICDAYIDRESSELGGFDGAWDHQPKPLETDAHINDHPRDPVLPDFPLPPRVGAPEISRSSKESDCAKDCPMASGEFGVKSPVQPPEEDDTEICHLLKGCGRGAQSKARPRLFLLDDEDVGRGRPVSQKHGDKLASSVCAPSAWGRVAPTKTRPLGLPKHRPLIPGGKHLGTHRDPISTYPSRPQIVAATTHSQSSSTGYTHKTSPRTSTDRLARRRQVRTAPSAGPPARSRVAEVVARQPSYRFVPHFPAPLLSGLPSACCTIRRFPPQPGPAPARPLPSLPAVAKGKRSGVRAPKRRLKSCRAANRKGGRVRPRATKSAAPCGAAPVAETMSSSTNVTASETTALTSPLPSPSPGVSLDRSRCGVKVEGRLLARRVWVHEKKQRDIQRFYSLKGSRDGASLSNEISADDGGNMAEVTQQLSPRTESSVGQASSSDGFATERDETPRKRSPHESVVSGSSDRRVDQLGHTRRHRRAGLPAPLKPSPRRTASPVAHEPDLPEQDLAVRLQDFEDAMIDMIEQTQRLFTEFGSSPQEEERVQVAHGQGQGQHQHQLQHEYHRREGHRHEYSHQSHNSFQHRDEYHHGFQRQDEYGHEDPRLWQGQVERDWLPIQPSSTHAAPVPRGPNVPHGQQQKKWWWPVEEQRYTPTATAKQRRWDVRAGSADDVFGH